MCRGHAGEHTDLSHARAQAEQLRSLPSARLAALGGVVRRCDRCRARHILTAGSEAQQLLQPVQVRLVREALGLELGHRELDHFGQLIARPASGQHADDGSQMRIRRLS